MLFVIIPIFEDGDHVFRNGRADSLVGAASQMDADDDDKASLPKESLYKFHPQPNNKLTDDCFRIMIAEDVLMLRKGLARSILQVFEKVANCPVSIHTACTAEDALRLAASQPFDIVISDNQFAPPTDLKRLGANDARPRILHDGGSKPRRNAYDFFRAESFTVEEGDGDLSGLQALLRLLDASDRPGPTPILVLLSGNKFDPAANRGMIVAQKPLRTSEIVSLLEAHASGLIESGLCFEEVDKSGERYRVVNQRGSQIFCRAMT